MREELFRHIESPEFSAVANLASSLRLFKEIISEQPLYNELLDAQPSIDEDLDILRRVLVLRDCDVDDRFRSPYDVALAVYMIALFRRHRRIALAAANAVTQTTQLWWARKISEEIISATEADRPIDRHEQRAEWSVPASPQPGTSISETERSELVWRIDTHHVETAAVSLDAGEHTGLSERDFA